MIENRRAPRVSVQRRSAANLVEGQIGTGALIAPDTVLLPPDTVQAVAQERGIVEIVLGPASFAHDDEGSPLDAVVERRQIADLEIIGTVEVDGVDVNDVARATLDVPSEYLPVVELAGGADRAGQVEEFRKIVENGTDLWTALEQVGALPPALRIPPEPQWLADAEFNLRSRAPRYDNRRIVRVAALSNPLCWIVPWACKK